MRYQILSLFAALGFSLTLSGQSGTVASTNLDGTSMVYDQARSRLVFFGGNASWEWNRSQWGEGTPGSLASPVYHPPSRQVVGVASGNLIAFDGHAYTNLGPVPFGQAQVNLVHDHANASLLALTAGFGNLAQLWAWDGASWQQRPPLNLPGLVYRAGYDVGRARLVVVVINAQPLGVATVEWDGTAWGQPVSGAPFLFAIAYDTPGQRMLGVLGGQTYAWDGTSWTAIGMTAGVGTPIQMSSDPAGGRVLMTATQAANTPKSWEWDGSSWAPIPDLHPIVNQPRLTFDAARDRAVLFGSEEHHEWDGSRWSEIAAAGGPWPRQYYCQAYDSARQEILVFGGRSSGPGGVVRLGDTWAYDGQWRLVATSGPAARSAAVMTEDSGRQRIVLVGGLDASSTRLQDHWEWDGLSWTLRSATTPMGRVYGGIGYDPLRARTVFVDNTYNTWEYDGTAWTLAGTGPVRSYQIGNLTWDSQRQRLQGFLRNGGILGDRHEWDGQQWLLVGGGPTLLCHDPLRGIVLDYTADRLQHDSPVPASASAYGAPCGGVAITTSLTAFGRPRPGNGGFYLDLRADAALRPAMVGFATGAASVSLGNGCTLLLQNPFASQLWFTNSEGFLHQPVAIPNDLSLRGLQIMAQGAVLDPMSPGGIALTQGLRLVLGD